MMMNIMQKKGKLKERDKEEKGTKETKKRDKESKIKQDNGPVGSVSGSLSCVIQVRPFSRPPLEERFP